MTAVAHLKLVPDNHVDHEIAEIEGDILAKKRQMIKGGKNPADLLPPSGEPRRYDDLANAAHFLSIIGDEMLYCAEAKKWFIWKGTCWEPDREDFVFDFAAEFAQSLYDDATDEAALKNAKRACNKSGFTAFLDLAQRKKATSIATFDDKDQTGRLLNCRNGTLDLKTGDLRPHDRADRITRSVNCDFLAEAPAPTFIKFLERIQPDPTIRAFLQRSIGYSLLGSVRERSFWILYGTGNNGKSIFTNLILNLLGEYGSTTTTQSIMQGSRSAIPNDIARLKGKRFIVVPETEENERMNAALVKALSAGDKVSARFLFAEFFDFYFTGKLWIATNHKPTITDHSKGFWDRCKLVPFAEDIPASEVIKSDDLTRGLMAEASGILAWMVQGARDYFESDGLDVPPVIQAEIDAYKFEQDSVAQFLEERCQTLDAAREIREKNPSVYFTESEFQISNSDLYKAYEKFCRDNGEYQRSHRRFSQNMKERGFRQGNSSGRYWEGIRLVSE